MNDQQKIELGDFIIREVFSFNSDLAKTSLANTVLNKIQDLELANDFIEIEQERKNNAPAEISIKDDLKPIQTQQLWRGDKLIAGIDLNNEASGNYQIPDEKQNLCGICYKTYPPETLNADFEECHVCQSAGKDRPFCHDKNRKIFISGDTLRNEDSLTTELQVLQINETYVVSDKLGCMLIDDFVQAGWIVHDRVTPFETWGKDASNSSLKTVCKFMESYIGSAFCTGECDHYTGININQKVVICNLYNKEHENGI